MGASHSQSQVNKEFNKAVVARREPAEASDNQTNERDGMMSELSQLRSKPQLSTQQEFPHKYKEIMKEADSPVDMSSPEKLKLQLYDGVLLDHGRKLYWLHKKYDSICFMLCARALAITWSENPNYWHWLSHDISSDKSIEVAELVSVCWLEVHGKFETRHLSPGMLYEVSFVVMLKKEAYGWDVPVNLSLVLPNGNKKQVRKTLSREPRDMWVEIPVGEFLASEKEVGEIELSMFEYHGGQWKGGLVIQGVTVNSKTRPNLVE